MKDVCRLTCTLFVKKQTNIFPQNRDKLLDYKYTPRVTHLNISMKTTFCFVVLAQLIVSILNLPHTVSFTGTPESLPLAASGWCFLGCPWLAP